MPDKHRLYWYDDDCSVDDDDYLSDDDDSLISAEELIEAIWSVI